MTLPPQLRATSAVVVMDSGLDASHRPGMTEEWDSGPAARARPGMTAVVVVVASHRPGMTEEDGLGA
jgi:hypothetical protein